MIYYFSLLPYVKTFAGELNPDLKVNLNGHPPICYVIQFWIRLKKLYFHRKWQNQFTHKSVSILIIFRNSMWMKNWIYITTFSKKFPNKCKEQTNSKGPSNFFHYTRFHPKYGDYVYVKNKLDSQIYLLSVQI